MKKYTFTAALCAAALFLTGCGGASKGGLTYQPAEPIAYSATGDKGNLSAPAEETQGLHLVGENNFLQMYCDEKTAAVSVYDRRSGEWWRTNPVQSDAALTPEAQSQISLDTITSAGVMRHYTSYSDCVRDGQMQYQYGKNSVRVLYTIGNNGPDKSGIPLKLTGERYTEICERMDSTGKSRMKNRYVYDEDKDVWSLKEKNLTKDMTKKLRESLKAIGYSEKELAADHRATGVSDEDVGSNGFEIPLDYVLQEDSLLVQVPLEEVSFPKDELVTAMNLVKYFGALVQDQPGYLFIPDGSGALIGTDPVKASVGEYRQRIYGTDEALSEDTRGSNQQYNILLPVYGINNGSTGVLAIVEDDTASAYINAVGCGGTDAYATVCASFEVNASENIGLSNSATSKFWVSTESRYSGNAAVRFVFLEEKTADYSGMAAAYRGYLTRYEDLDAGQSNLGDSLPFFAETVGAVGTEVSTAGFLRDVYVPLTSYTDNISIAQKLLDGGVGDVRLILNAWMKGGDEQPLAQKAALMKELGGKNAFAQLTDYVDKSSGKVRLYPEVLFNSMSKDASLSLSNRYSSRSLGQKKSKLQVYDIVTGQVLDDSYSLVVSPAQQKTLAQRFMKSFATLGAQGLCIGDLAGSAYGDFNSKNEVLRPYAILQAGEILKSVKDTTQDVLFRAPNNTTAPLSTVYSDVPEASSGYLLFDASVPFYQMVFHGFAEYSLGNLNWSADYRQSLLKCVEYGACPKFKFTYEAGEELRVTDTDRLCAANFDQQAEKALEGWSFINEKLAPVHGSQMICHRTVQEGVYAVDYANGYTAYVNYTAEAVNVEGVTVNGTDAVLHQTGRGS